MTPGLLTAITFLPAVAALGLAAAPRRSSALIRVVVKVKAGTRLDDGQVRGVLSALPGVRAVQPKDGEGNGTLGYTLRAIGGDDPREAIFAAAVSHGFVLLDLHREKVSLEDTFRRLTSNPRYRASLAKLKEGEQDYMWQLGRDGWYTGEPEQMQREWWSIVTHSLPPILGGGARNDLWLALSVGLNVGGRK
jgi:hypothetical protein